ncbi:Bug family tripartite tricarboxylate transporter substrate binding protein [Muricoccus radiodurans]|uniref:Bug family tripartite tricarboxylate transporter substrate binding protein n=1 Tax=Muricoccus radiodurans TaxID=2231721 RepID=UPI003CF348F5
MPDHQGRRGLLTLAAAASLAALARPAIAQAYPSRTITIIVGYAPGGASDIIARSVGDEITRATGQTVVVDYRPGGGGGIAGDLVARARPDGYTLLAVSNTFYAVIPFLASVRYDPLTDLTPVGFAGDGFMAAVVHPSVPARNLSELVAHARANPGKLNFGTSGQGSLAQLCGEYLKKRTGIDIVHVPYRGGSAAVQACIANEVQIIFGAESAEAVGRGDLRGVAVLGSERWDKMPDVPTTEEAGLPGWALRSWHGIAVPAGTPPEVCERLNHLVNEMGAMPAIVARFGLLGFRPQPQTLAELEARRRADHAAFSSLIRDAGLTRG